MGTSVEPSTPRSAWATGRRAALAAARTLARWVAEAFLFFQLFLVATAAVLALLAAQRPVLVEGGSMRPNLEPGDVLIIDSVDDGTDLVGRVATFVNNGQRVSHRVVESPEPGQFVTRGDANRTNDSTIISDDQIEGAANYVVPAIGRPIYWLRQAHWVPFGAWAVAILLALRVARRAPTETTELVEPTDPVEPVEPTPLHTFLPPLSPPQAEPVHS